MEFSKVPIVFVSMKNGLAYEKVLQRWGPSLLSLIDKKVTRLPGGILVVSSIAKAFF